MKQIIGSDIKAEINLSGRYIAPRHAELIEAETKVYILDLNSQFGTFVNGKKIESKFELKVGDRVKIGTQLFHWQDYLNESSKSSNEYPIYFTDLFNPAGFIEWQTFKISMIVFIGLLILTPIAIPSFLRILPHVIYWKERRKIEELNLLEYSNGMTLLICLVIGYIILNLTQKIVRLKLKNRP